MGVSIENVKTIKNDLEYLRQISKEVNFNDSKLLDDIEVLTKFCKENEVLAMAAVQLGIPKRIIYLKNTNLDIVNKDQQPDAVVDLDYDEQTIMINPIITKRIGLTTYWEACASCLNNVGLVKRPYIIEMEYYDLEQNKHTKTFEGFPSTVISHEYDHLNGILHIDIADKILDLEAEERKKLRLQPGQGYEIVSKDGDYEQLKEKHKVIKKTK